MKNSGTPNPSLTKKWLRTILICCFLLVWFTGMTAGFTAAVCKKNSDNAPKKLRYCTISIASGFWFDLSPLERSKRSGIRVERGIALARLDRTQEATDAFEAALEDIKKKDFHRFFQLVQRMYKEADTSAQDPWLLAVERSKWASMLSVAQSLLRNDQAQN